MAKSKNGNGAIPYDTISVTIQTALLDRVDRYAIRKDLNRSQIIGRAIRRFLAAELADDPDFWQALYDAYDETGKI
jgi:predicted transcriptional regulator